MNLLQLYVSALQYSKQFGIGILQIIIFILLSLNLLFLQQNFKMANPQNLKQISKIQSAQQSKVIQTLENDEINVNLYHAEIKLVSLQINIYSNLFDLIELIKKGLKFDIDLQRGIQSLKDPNIVFKGDFSLNFYYFKEIIEAQQLDLVIFREVHEKKSTNFDISVLLRDINNSNKEYLLSIDSKITLEKLAEFIKYQLGFSVDLSKGFRSIIYKQLIFQCYSWRMDQISIILNYPQIQLYYIQKQSTSFPIEKQLLDVDDSVQVQEIVETFPIEIKIFDQTQFLDVRDSVLVQEIVETFSEIYNIDKHDLVCYDVFNNPLDLLAKCVTLEIIANLRFMKITKKSVQSFEESKKANEPMIKPIEIAINIYESDKILISIFIQLDCDLIELIEFIKQELQFQIELLEIQQVHPNYREIYSENSFENFYIKLFLLEVAGEDVELEIDQSQSLEELTQFIKQQLGFSVDLSKGFQSTKNPKIIFRRNFWNMDQISKILNSTQIELTIYRQKQWVIIEIDVFDELKHIEIEDQVKIQEVIEYFLIEIFYCYDAHNKLLDISVYKTKCSHWKLLIIKDFLSQQIEFYE
ncbi:hypothetical protein pb186bvf_018687 [Paramecium bursaria]